jgi:hypothetical protein
MIGLVDPLPTIPNSPIGGNATRACPDPWSGKEYSLSVSNLLAETAIGRKKVAVPLTLTPALVMFWSPSFEMCWHSRTLWLP